MVVKVGNQVLRGGAPTYAIKDLLKASGYQWQSKGWPGWAKFFPADGFKIEILHKEIWSKVADGIEIRIFDSTERILDCYYIDNGNWHNENDEYFILRNRNNKFILCDSSLN